MAGHLTASEKQIELTITALRGGKRHVANASSAEYGLGSHGPVVSDHFPLTKKLLARPPFAFIHAVVIEAHGITGFGGHTALSDFELSGKFPQQSDRAGRVALLIKLLAYIDHVIRHNDTAAGGGGAGGASATAAGQQRRGSVNLEWGEMWVPCVMLVSPTKLLAGKEPDRTLAMLQKLAIAARKVREDHTRAVRAAQHIKTQGAHALYNHSLRLRGILAAFQNIWRRKISS